MCQLFGRLGPPRLQGSQQLRIPAYGEAHQAQIEGRDDPPQQCHAFQGLHLFSVTPAEEKPIRRMNLDGKTAAPARQSFLNLAPETLHEIPVLIPSV